jgi:hypothetical protein
MTGLMIRVLEMVVRESHNRPSRQQMTKHSGRALVTAASAAAATASSGSAFSRSFVWSLVSKRVLTHVVPAEKNKKDAPPGFHQATRPNG